MMRLNTTSRDDVIYEIECAYNFVEQNIYMLQDLYIGTQSRVLFYATGQAILRTPVFPQHCAGAVNAFRDQIALTARSALLRTFVNSE